MTQRSSEIATAVEVVRARLDRAGGHHVRIVAVAKGFPWTDIRAVMDAGIHHIGENYAQEILAKYSPLTAEERPVVHFIGRLQSNKVRPLAPLVSVWQSVDRERLLEEVAQHAPGSEVLIQVNVTGEGDKGGCDPDRVETLVRTGGELGLRVSGLMVVGPTSGDPRSTKEAFTRAARLRSELQLPELSMGMTNDLETAVELGTTMVRVGTALFGGRPPKD